MWSYQLRCRAVFHSRSAHMRSCTQPWQVMRAKLWASIRRRPSDERTTKERFLHEFFCFTRSSSTPGTGVGMAYAGRLTVPVDPPFVPMTPLQQAKRLSDGTTVLGFPAGLRWTARHDLSRFRNGYAFSDVCTNAPMRVLANWRHDHLFEDH